jgi:hypothetical protein
MSEQTASVSPKVAAIIKAVKLDGSFEVFVVTDSKGEYLPAANFTNRPSEAIHKLVEAATHVEASWASYHVVDVVETESSYTICYLALVPLELKLDSGYKFTNQKDLTTSFKDWELVKAIGLRRA